MNTSNTLSQADLTTKLREWASLVEAKLEALEDKESTLYLAYVTQLEAVNREMRSMAKGWNTVWWQEEENRQKVIDRCNAAIQKLQ